MSEQANIAREDTTMQTYERVALEIALRSAISDVLIRAGVANNFAGISIISTISHAGLDKLLTLSGGTIIEAKCPSKSERATFLTEFWTYAEVTKQEEIDPRVNNSQYIEELLTDAIDDYGPLTSIYREWANGVPMEDLMA